MGSMTCTTKLMLFMMNCSTYLGHYKFYIVMVGIDDVNNVYGGEMRNT